MVFECFFRTGTPAFLMTPVKLRQKIQFAALPGGCGRAVTNVLDKLFDLRLPRVNMRRLVGAWKKRRSPVLISLCRQAIRTQHDEAGQILVFRTKAVGNPRPKAGPNLADIAAIHHHQGRLMIRDVRVHRTNDA